MYVSPEMRIKAEERRQCYMDRKIKKKTKKVNSKCKKITWFMDYGDINCFVHKFEVTYEYDTESDNEEVTVYFYPRQYAQKIAVYNIDLERIFADKDNVKVAVDQNGFIFIWNNTEMFVTFIFGLNANYYQLLSIEELTRKIPLFTYSDPEIIRIEYYDVFVIKSRKYESSKEIYIPFKINSDFAYGSSLIDLQFLKEFP